MFWTIITSLWFIFVLMIGCFGPRILEKHLNKLARIDRAVLNRKGDLQNVRL